MRIQHSTFYTLLITCLSCVSALSLSGKITVTSPDGLDNTYSLDEAPTVSLDGSTWKLTFNTDSSVILNQAHLLFEADSGDVTLPVTVKKGKGVFAINSAKPHPALLPTSGTFKLTLLLSTLIDQTSKSLGSITLPSSSLKPTPRGRHDLPPRQGEPAFTLQPEISHTFQEEPKQIGSFKALIGMGLVIAPWFLLALLHGNLKPKYAGLSTYSMVFLLSLFALEGLILIYWLRLRLYQFLPIFLPLSLVSAYTGKLALSRK